MLSSFFSLVKSYMLLTSDLSYKAMSFVFYFAFSGNLSNLFVPNGLHFHSDVS